MLVQAAMQLSRLRDWGPVRRMSEHPKAAQQGVLRRLLWGNRETRFGIEHGFARIDAAPRYQEQVPVQDYETLRAYIDEQRRSGVPALTAEAPIFYSQTSGSTGRPKYIPVTASALAQHRREQALFTYLQFRACPTAFDGKALGIVGACVEDRL